MARLYAYNTRNQRGKIVKGTIEGESSEQVARKLKEDGYIVLNIKPKQQAQEISLDFFQRKKVKKPDLVIYARQMATMFEAGLTLVEILDILNEQTEHPTLKEINRQLQQDVERGKTFFAALAAHPKVFPPLFRQMIKAGEEAGVLDEVLNRLADHLERENELNQKVKSAMMYPAVIGVVAVLVVIFLLTFVIPQFVGIFAGAGAELPWPTRMIMNISEAFQSYWWAIFGGLLALLGGLKLYTNTDNGKEVKDRILLRMPLFGKLVRKVSVSQFSRTMATLSTAGISIFEGLRIVEDVVTNKVISRTIADTYSKLGEGATLSQPLISSGQFPKMVTQMIAIGEETGNVDTMLNKIADFYDKEVEHAVEGLIKMIEPMLVVVVAVVVGFIVISIAMPMFEMMTVIQ